MCVFICVDRFKRTNAHLIIMDFTETKEAKLLKEIIIKNKLQQKTTYDELKKYFIIEGLSISSFSNYLFALTAFEIVERQKENIIINKEFWVGCKQ